MLKALITATVFTVSLATTGQAAQPLAAPDLEKLHIAAAKCDADNSGVPDTDTCVPTYNRLIAHYGGYEAFVKAAQAWKGKRG
jgi:hypothetical protein